MKKLSPLSKRNRLVFVSVLFATLALSNWACVSSPEKSENALTPSKSVAAFSVKAPNEVSVMTFNVENLFDTLHDQGKEDYTYLPLAKKNTPEVKAACEKLTNNHYRNECFEMNWDEETLKVKMTNLAKVILDLDGGQGPDVLIMAEVENERVLKILSENYLQAAKYKNIILIEGPDNRGIDVAVMTRLDVIGKPELHKVDWKPQAGDNGEVMNRLRGLLQVKVKLPDGTPLNIFSVHFPSQANPRHWREQSLDSLLRRLTEVKDKKELFIAGGDMNITAEEEAETGFFSKKAANVGLVSHLVGCKTCEGSHSYRRSWSFLDVMIFSPTFNSADNNPNKWVLEKDSIDVIRYNPVHVNKYKAPIRFSEEKKSGVSDHFPLYARIKKLP